MDCNGGGVADCADNEMGFLFWEEGISSAAAGPFSNVQTARYWSSTESSSNTDRAWRLGFGTGGQGADLKVRNRSAWAVRSGDIGVSAVPVPAAAWLFGSGMIGLLGVARRRR